jgi:hypothetical protein
MLVAVRALACVIVLATLGGAASGNAATRGVCPHSAGNVTYVRSGVVHEISLATCSARSLGKAKRASSALRSAQGRLARIAATSSEQTIEVDGKAVLRVREDHRTVPGGVPGPLGLVMWSPDGRWLFYFIDPMGSASLAADGLVLRALNVATGRTLKVTQMLLYDDYMTWCGSTLVLTTGPIRLATWNKRLVAATAPTWKPRPIWNTPARAFGSVACAPDGRSVAVLSQKAQQKDWNFFHTRWALWRVGLDGSARLLDTPPAGFADESPHWSPDGLSVLFVRERKGTGTLQVLRNGHVYGPIAHLGYSLGYYGHHDWEVAWRR